MVRVRPGTGDVILSLKAIHSNLLKVLNMLSSPLKVHAREVDQSYSKSRNAQQQYSYTEYVAETVHFADAVCHSWIRFCTSP